MAVASYTKDLTDINLGTGTWVELTGAAVGGGPAAETDYFIEGTGCQSQTMNATGLGSAAINVSATITAGSAVFIWIYWTSPNTLTSLASGGIRVAVGSGVGAYKMWNVNGSDTYTYGGWINYAVDPTVTPSSSAGTPTSTTSYFGAVVNNSIKVAKGNPFGVDAIRWGRTLQVVSGDASAYGTFLGAATKNDYNDATNGYNRWGLFQAIDGGYLHKGLFLMGVAASACDFRDSNRNIAIQNTVHVGAAFNAYEVRNASSRVDWTNIQISSLGTVSRGTFTATDNADINFDTCTFNDMSTFVFQSNSTVLDTTFRKCGQVTQGSGIFTGCRFENCREAVSILSNNPAAITNGIFVSDGSNHAIELTSACAGNSYAFTGHTFTGYSASNGSGGNEVIKNSSGGAVTLNVSNCTGTISVYDVSPAVTTLSTGSVNATVTVLNDTGSPLVSANVLVVAASGGALPYDVTVTSISNSTTTATVNHTAHGMISTDKVMIKGASLWQNNGVFAITKVNDNQYTYTMVESPGSSPTGTIKATYAALSGYTDSNGQVTMSRIFASSQPISGKARKSSTAPYYKTATFIGTISSTNGYTNTVQMIPDQ